MLATATSFSNHSTSWGNVFPSESVPVTTIVISWPAVWVVASRTASTRTALPWTTETETASLMLYPESLTAEAEIDQFPTAEASQRIPLASSSSVITDVSPVSRLVKYHPRIDESIGFVSKSARAAVKSMCSSEVISKTVFANPSLPVATMETEFKSPWETVTLMLTW